jgi:hypothetical protein
MISLIIGFEINNFGYFFLNKRSLLIFGVIIDLLDIKEVKLRVNIIDKSI